MSESVGATTTASVTIGTHSLSLWNSDWLNIIPKDIPCLMVLWLWWRVLCAAVRDRCFLYGTLSCFFTLLLYDMCFLNTHKPNFIIDCRSCESIFHNSTYECTKITLKILSRPWTQNNLISRFLYSLFRVMSHAHRQPAESRMFNFFLDLGNSSTPQGSIVSFQPWSWILKMDGYSNL